MVTTNWNSIERFLKEAMIIVPAARTRRIISENDYNFEWGCEHSVQWINVFI